jgi:hypothetical protein
VTDVVQRGLAWVREQDDPHEIDRALAAGELDRLLAGEDVDAATADPATPLTDAEIGGMSAQQLVDRAQHDPALAARIGITITTPPSNADQGARGKRQTERQRLASMRPEQLRDELRSGALDPLLRGET